MNFFSFGKKRRKTSYQWINEIPLGVKIGGALLLIILIVLSASSFYISQKRLTTGASNAVISQTDIFNKIVYYDVEKNVWKNFNTAGTEEVISMGMDTNLYMIYATATKVQRINYNTNSNYADVTAAYINAGGVPSNIVDITSANQYTYILEKNAKIMWTGDGGTTWNKTNAPTNPVITDAKYIGADGVAVELVSFGSNKIIYYSSAGWSTVETPDFNFTTYGNISSIEYDAGYRMVSTDKGYIMQPSNSGGTSGYKPLNYRSPGEYIFGNIYHNNNGYYFGSALTSDKTTVGFIQYSGSGTSVTLHSLIPGCQIGKSVVYQYGAALSYAATVGSTCDPNSPAPPAPTTVTNNFTYKGISIHTKVVGPDGVSATAKKGDTVTFTLTINNPDTAAKTTDVKFTLPPQFTFVTTPAPGYTISPASSPAPTFSQASQVLTWTNYNAPVGESMITLKALVP